MKNILEISGLRKEYKNFTLNDISFNLPRGYIMGLIGPNGAGKTTIIKLIMNLIRKNNGQITIFGKDHIRDEVDIKSRIGFVYDNHPFYEDVSLKNIARAISYCYKSWDNEIFTNLLQKFSLPADKKFGKLSRGMKMKFSLALAFSHHADLIIMDEPTSGLDPVFRRELLDLLADIIQDEQKSVLFSTHITSDLEKIADYITFIHQGNIVFSCEKDELTENWAVVKGGTELLSEEHRPLLTAIRKTEFGIHALTQNKQMLQKTSLKDIVIERASLEDIMFYLTKNENNKQ